MGLFRCWFCRWFYICHWAPCNKHFFLLLSNRGSPTMTEPLKLVPIGPPADLPTFDRPVFIIAAPRSGSTLLFDSLRKLQGLWSIGRESHAIFDGVLGHHVGNPHFESIRATARDATAARVQMLVREFSHGLIDALGRRWTDLPANARPASIRLLDKLPKNSFRVAFLAAAFPDARFIFLTREPRGNISSLIEAWREGGRTGRFVTYKRLPGSTFENWCFVLAPGWRDMVDKGVADIAAFQWARANETALDDLQDLPPDHWCTVSYADLVAQPTAQLRRLAMFIGLGFDERDIGLENGALATSRTALSPPSPDKWRRHAVEIERILPQVQATADRIEQMILAKARASAPWPLA
jgi:hypothetical protein